MFQVMLLYSETLTNTVKLLLLHHHPLPLHSLRSDEQGSKHKLMSVHLWCIVGVEMRIIHVHHLH